MHIYFWTQKIPTQEIGDSLFPLSERSPNNVFYMFPSVCMYACMYPVKSASPTHPPLRLRGGGGCHSFFY